MKQLFPWAWLLIETRAIKPSSLYLSPLFMGGILHRGKALVSKLYSSVQALGGMSHFMGTSVLQLAPSVQYTNYKFSHKHCLEAHHKKLAGSDLYPCILYVLYSAQHAAVTFDDCSRLKLGQNSDFPQDFYRNKCHVLCGYTKTWSLHIWSTVWRTDLKRGIALIQAWKHPRPR